MKSLSTRIKVLVFAPYFPPAYLGGGPIRTLSAMVVTSPDDFSPRVITSDTDLGQKQPLPVLANTWSEYRGVSVYYGSRSPLGFARALRRACQVKPEIVYLSSFFSFRFSILPQLLMLAGLLRPKYVGLAPRGEFGDGALSLKSRKKRIYLGMYRLTGMTRRVNWHASSDREAGDIVRAVGADAKVFTRENDSDLPLQASKGQPAPTTELKAVFVGRIVPIKGLLTLLQALVSCEETVSLDIYGPEEDPAYARQCRETTNQLPANIKVSFKGPVSNESVQDALPGYDVMLFPTLGENFGHVIAESLSASCPVVCADVTPWTERLRNGGGKVVNDHTPEGWSEVISSFARLSLEGRAETRAMAAECFRKWRAGLSQAHVFHLLAVNGVRFSK